MKSSKRPAANGLMIMDISSQLSPGSEEEEHGAAEINSTKNNARVQLETEPLAFYFL